MRSKNAVLNALSNVFGQVLILVLNFLLRKVFLHVLDTNYLGISGLFTSVITMLSLAELGIGTAITYNLYKPLLNGDKEIIASLMNLYKNIYRVIGIVVLIIGIAITPLVMFMTEVEVEIPYLEWIYVLFVINTAISYFFSYNRTLIVADQKEYKLLLIDTISKIALIVLQASILLVTHNYILYLITQIVMTFVQNFWVYQKVQKLYPILKKQEMKKLPEEILQNIKKNTLAMMIYKLAVVIVSGTDNLIISKMLGTIWVGFYSNYSMVILSVQTICSKMISAVTSSIGNIVAAGNKNESYLIYETLQMVCFLVYGMCTVIMLVTLNPFVKLFFGGEYVLPQLTVIVLLINFFLLGMQGASASVRDVQGIFWQGKLRPLAQGILNLVISIILVYCMENLTAVFLGTIISRVLTVTWFDPYAVHKYGFKEVSKLKGFAWKYLRYIILLVLAGGTAFWLARLYNENTLLALFYKASVAGVVFGLIFILFLGRTEEFRFLKSRLVEVVKSIMMRKSVS